MFINHNIYRLFSESVNCVLFQSLRRSHFKFNVTQSKQQNCLINKFIQKNQNILNKLLDNKPKIISKGSPDRQTIDCKEDDNKLMTRRMTVLNKQLMQCISDVLSTEQIGQKLCELQVRITQVRVNRRCDSANFYWVSKSDETERIAEELDQMKGRLHQHMLDRNIMHSVPWIQFVLDINESHSQEVERVLRKCDYGPDFQPFDSTLFETPYETISKPNDKPKNENKIQFNQNVYEFLKIQKPNDMEMNCLGLDYESIINIVLMNLKKSRAQHRSFNAVADPLPPLDWSTPPNIQSNIDLEAVYNTDERIKVMKRFLIENRKKSEKLSREKKRKIILEEMQISSQLNEAFDNFEQQIEDDFNYDFNSEQNSDKF